MRGTLPSRSCTPSWYSAWSVKQVYLCFTQLS